MNYFAPAAERFRLIKAKNKRLVNHGDQVVTAYHPGRNKERSLLQCAERQAFED